MKILALLVFLATGIGFAQNPVSSPPDSASAGKTVRSQADHRAKPRLIALLFRADWCPTCKVLEPQYRVLQQDLEGEPILFVRLDFTDEETTKESTQRAAHLGLESIYNQVKGSTGFALLVTPSTKTVVGVITIDETPTQMKAMFTRALEP